MIHFLNFLNLYLKVVKYSITNTFIIFFILFLGLCSCTKNTQKNNSEVLIDTLAKCDSVTLVNTPLNISWIQKVIAGRDCQYILQGAQMSTCIYNNRIVVFFENPASNLGTCVGKVYGCDGTILLNWMDTNWLDFQNKHQNKKTFWIK